jgi:hypothetical protein
VSATERQLYTGTRPAALRVERRADGRVRLRIETPGADDAMIDLAPVDVADLVETLRGGA